MKRTEMIIILLMLCSGTCLAAASPELSNQVDQQISTIRNALHQPETTSSCSNDGIGDANGEDSWYFRNIWIRLTTPVGFKIPGLAGFSVVPTFEVLVQRALPDGWEVYQPQQKRAASELAAD